jgi:hypothetical protein
MASATSASIGPGELPAGSENKAAQAPVWVTSATSSMTSTYDQPSYFSLGDGELDILTSGANLLMT